MVGGWACPQWPLRVTATELHNFMASFLQCRILATHRLVCQSQKKSSCDQEVLLTYRHLWAVTDHAVALLTHRPCPQRKAIIAHDSSLTYTGYLKEVIALKTTWFPRSVNLIAYVTMTNVYFKSLHGSWWRSGQGLQPPSRTSLLGLSLPGQAESQHSALILPKVC